MVGTVWSYGPVFADSATTVSGGSGVPKTYISNSATGFTFTLPAATGTGHCYRFIVGVTITSGSLVIAAAGTDEFRGHVYAVDTDSTDAHAVYPAVASDNFDDFTMNGGTTGGLTGDIVEVTDIGTGLWSLRASINQTGTAASPLS